MISIKFKASLLSLCPKVKRLFGVINISSDCSDLNLDTGMPSDRKI